MDRRSIFFLMAAAVSALLILPAPPDLRWVPLWLGVTYVVLALLSLADHLSNRSSDHRDTPDEVSRTGR
jgi:hypothetical protein